MAGCVTGHSAFIYDRGGTRHIASLRDLSLVKYERVRDNISEATVRLLGDACSDQQGIIDAIRTHRHEMRLFRGDEIAWEGVIHRAASTDGEAEIVAKDILTYLDYQPLTQTYSNATVGGVKHVDTVTGRIEKIIEYELSHGRIMRVPKAGNNAHVTRLRALGWTIDTVASNGGFDVHLPALEADELLPAINVLAHMNVHHFPNEAETTAVTEPYEYTVFEHLLSLARRAGIDFTVVGRALHIWDVSRNLGRLPQWTEANFTDKIIVTEYGSDHTQAAYSSAQNGLYGSALNLENLEFYGPWTTIYTAYQEEGTPDPSQVELNSQARRNVSGRSPAPIEVRVPDNASLILDDTVTLRSLVPGTQVMLRATLAARQVAQLQKIDHVVVTEDEKGEHIQVTLTPATKPDSDDEDA